MSPCLLVLLYALPLSLAQVITPAPSLDDIVRRVYKNERPIEARDVLSGTAYNNALKKCYGTGSLCDKTLPKFNQCNFVNAGQQLLCWCTVGYYDARNDCLSCQASASLIESSSYSYEKSRNSLDCSSRIGAASASGSLLSGSAASDSQTSRNTRATATTDDDAAFTIPSFTYPSYTYPTYTSSSSSRSGGGVSLSPRKKFPIGAIIGIIVGAIVAVGGVFAGILAARKKKQRAAAGLGPPQMSGVNNPGPPPGPPPPPMTDGKTPNFSAPEVVSPGMSPPPPQQHGAPPVSPMSAHYPSGQFPPPQQQQQGPPGYFPPPTQQSGPPGYYPQQAFTPPPGPPPQSFSPPPGPPPAQQQGFGGWQGANTNNSAEMPGTGARGPDAGTGVSAAEMGGVKDGAAPAQQTRHEMGS